MGQSASLTAAAILLVCGPSHFVVETAGASSLPQQIAPTQASRSPAPRRDPGPRASIAGIAGFDSLSKIRLSSSPGVVRDLKVTCSFPERMRWMTSAEIDGLLVRELEYQYGDAAYRIPTGTAVSHVCEGESRTEVLRRMKLRIALMLFPDGFEWKGDGGERTTDMDLLGSLRALIPANSAGQPSAIDCIDSAGRTTEGYRGITWRRSQTRSWPATMEFWRGQERVWTETVESIDTTAHFVDSFFLPPDLREGSTARPVVGGIRTLDIPETCILRTAIAAGTSWEAALRDLGDLRSTQSKLLDERGLTLEEIATFEVSDQGEPIASILRLTTIPEIIPEGFVKDGGRHGLALAVEGLARVERTRVDELRRGLPQGSVALRPYVRFGLAGEANRRVVLVLPFDASR